jgi:dienelactone hydrolase
MFEYFKEQYVRNLATNMAINLGASMSEIDSACRHLLEPASPGPETPEGIRAFFEAWRSAGDKLAALAAADEHQRNLLGAGNKYRRATIYLMTAERVEKHGSAERQATYRKMLECFARAVALREENCERVEVPYQGTSLPALFVRAQGRGPAPCMVHFDGLDVMKELLFYTGMAQELSARGISCLIVDHPGVGEALRLRGLHGFPETERPAAAAVDYLESRPDVDPSRIGMMALSLGGYYAVRSAAYEKRLRCCVAWGAMYDFGKRFRARAEGGGTQPSVPDFLAHCQWMLGTSSLEETLRVTSRMNLEEAAPQVECPILIVHGENDRQVPLEQARATYDACTRSSKRELKIHTLEEGGAEHCSMDNFAISIDYMAHWIAHTL